MSVHSKYSLLVDAKLCQNEIMKVATFQKGNKSAEPVFWGKDLLSRIRYYSTSVQLKTFNIVERNLICKMIKRYMPFRMDPNIFTHLEIQEKIIVTRAWACISFVSICSCLDLT